MTSKADNTANEFWAALRSLVDVWCERRCLPALSRILPSYLSFNGMTDGWGELHIALKNIIALHRDELTREELNVVEDLKRATDRILGPRR